jgi:hypothetical protein
MSSILVWEIVTVPNFMPLIIKNKKPRYNWQLFDHTPYSPHIALSEYHLYTYTKNWVGSQCFNNNEKLMEGETVAEFTTGRCFWHRPTELIPR